MKYSNAVTKILAMALCAISLTACTTPSQVYWDHKVKELCEKDGGVTVFEKVELTKSEKAKLRIAPSKATSISSDYYLEFNDEVINDDPKVRKSVGYLYRNSDQKLIAKQMYYSRVGGDLVPIDNPSSYNCDMAGVSTNIEKAVFIIKGE